MASWFRRREGGFGGGGGLGLARVAGWGGDFLVGSVTSVLDPLVSFIRPGGARGSVLN